MNRQIVQEAAEWFVELNADTPGTEVRRQFDTWLRTSPEHVRAFLEILPIWEDGAQLPLAAETTPAQLIEWAKSGENVIPIRAAAAIMPDGARRSPEARTAGRRARRLALAAGILAAVVGAALIWRYQEQRNPTFVTGIGEQRSLILPDDSTVDLNTASRVRIRYTQHERAVELLQGQALFNVTRNAGRPFVVYSGAARVRAVGTRFDVYRKAATTVVTVVEGRVTVSKMPEDGSAASAQGAIELSAGDQLSLAPGITKPVEHPSLASATAWTQRQLVFDSAPLVDVAEEFNRYNTRRLAVDAGRLADFRISGIFSSTDPSSLIRFLREQPGVRVSEADGEIRVWRE